MFKEACRYLFENKILRQSIKDHEEYPDASESDIADDMKLYLSSKGLRIWKLLYERSLLLELLRDDVYSQTSLSQTITADIKNLSERLRDIISMLAGLFEAEKRLAVLAIESNNFTSYKDCFGRERLITHLMSGVKRTIYQYYKDTSTEDYTSVRSAFADFERQVTAFSNTLLV